MTVKPTLDTLRSVREIKQHPSWARFRGYIESLVDSNINLALNHQDTLMVYEHRGRAKQLKELLEFVDTIEDKLKKQI